MRNENSFFRNVSILLLLQIAFCSSFYKILGQETLPHRIQNFLTMSHLPPGKKHELITIRLVDRDTSPIFWIAKRSDGTHNRLRTGTGSPIELVCIPIEGLSVAPLAGKNIHV